LNIPTATRRIQFAAGHRVHGHESKCANAHGHNYVAWFEAEGSLDAVGRVIDFSVLKEKIGGWIDANWDHGFIVYGGDDQIYNALAAVKPRMKIFSMMDNPTAENMAKFLLLGVCPLVLAGTGVTVVSVRLQETENCEATARL
jgi:6-pyruvoyltetrahydropterin/6-carboxytetrahydropterin synthase